MFLKKKKSVLKQNLKKPCCKTKDKKDETVKKDSKLKTFIKKKLKIYLIN